MKFWIQLALAIATLVESRNSEALLAVPAFLIPLALSGISALGGLLSNRKSKIQQETTQKINELSAPEYDDKMLYMRNYLADRYLDRVSSNEDFFQGYQNEGLQNINEGADISGRNLESILASRGLGQTTAGATSAMMNQLSRGRQQNSFLNQIPLLADQRAQGNLQNAASFFSSLPVATRRTGTTTGTGTTTQPGNMLGGAFSSLGTALAGFYGQGAFGGPPADYIENMGKLRYPGTTSSIPPVNYNIVPPNYKLPTYG